MSTTLTIADGKTLTVNNSMTLSGTDGSTVNVGGGGTLQAIAYSGSASDLSSGTLPSGRLTGSYTGITGVGTLSTGTWNATVIGSAYGGTGVNNGSNTLTLAASLTTTGSGGPTLAFPDTAQTYIFQAANDTIVMRTTADTLTNKTLTSPKVTGAGAGTSTLQYANSASNTTLTIPATTGSVITSGDTGTVTNTMLANSTVTLNAGTNVGLTTPGAMSLGSTYTIGTTSDKVRLGALGLGVAAPGTNGQISATGGANNVTLLTLQRNTDTSPTGKFVDFQNAAASSLWTIDITGTLTAGTWQGAKVGLAYGGTNADLSATGGAHQVLKQSSAGAAVTVGQLAASDISGLNNQSTTAPTVTVYTSGSQTYTPPTGVVWIEVRMVAGGGGGAGDSTSGQTAGGTTTFGSWTCIGGSPGTNADFGGGIGGTGGATGTGTLLLRQPGQAGGGPGNSDTHAFTMGGYGGASMLGFGGQGISGNSGHDGFNGQTYGGGGSGSTGDRVSYGAGSGGGGGEGLHFIVTSPAAVTAVVGAGGTKGTGSNHNGGAGAGGVIIITEHYNN